MSVRLVAATAALLLACTTAAYAQTAPAAAADTPAAAAPAPAPAAAPAAASAQASEGKLAYYGAKFAGRKTANGERFDPNALTMAHKTLPFGTLVKVTNTANKRSVVVRVNDRGPSTPDRVGDVSRAAAQRLKMLGAGVVNAQLEVVGKGRSRPAKAPRAA